MKTTFRTSILTLFAMAFSINVHGQVISQYAHTSNSGNANNTQQFIAIELFNSSGGPILIDANNFLEVHQIGVRTTGSGKSKQSENYRELTWSMGGPGVNLSWPTNTTIVISRSDILNTPGISAIANYSTLNGAFLTEVDDIFCNWDADVSLEVTYSSSTLNNSVSSTTNRTDYFGIQLTGGNTNTTTYTGTAGGTAINSSDWSLERDITQRSANITGFTTTNSLNDYFSNATPSALPGSNVSITADDLEGWGVGMPNKIWDQGTSQWLTQDGSAAVPPTANCVASISNEIDATNIGTPHQLELNGTGKLIIQSQDINGNLVQVKTKYHSRGGGKVKMERDFVSNGWHNVGIPVTSATSTNVTTGRGWSWNGAAWNAAGTAPASGHGINVLTGNTTYEFLATPGVPIAYEGIPLNEYTWSSNYNNGNTSEGPLFYSDYGGQGLAAETGWNLLSNPYTCGLDWDLVSSQLSAEFSGVSKSIYIQEPGYGYKLWTPDVTSGTAPSEMDNGVIPPMSSFWVQTTNSVNVIATNVEDHGTISSNSSYNKNASISKDVIKVDITSISDTTKKDRAYLVNDALANVGFDPGMDSWKWINSGNSNPALFFNSYGEPMTINSLDFNTTLAIPMGACELMSGETYTIDVMIESLSNYSVTLEDKLTNAMVNITNSKYYFTHPFENFEDRFNIFLSLNTVDLSENPTVENQAYAFFDDNSIVFTKLFDEDCIVTVHSTTGRLIAETQVSDKTSKITDVSEPGLYILRISYINDNKVTVLKLIR